jgi:hypothetical protein
MRLYHGTTASFSPCDFRLGMPSTTIPVGGGPPVPVRNSAAFFALDESIARTYGPTILEATLLPNVVVLSRSDIDWRVFEDDLKVARLLLSQGIGAVRFREGDAGYETVAVIDLASLLWLNGSSNPCKNWNVRSQALKRG